MDKIKKNLNSIGLGLLFAGLVALRIWPQTQDRRPRPGRPRRRGDRRLYRPQRRPSSRRASSGGPSSIRATLLLVIVLVLGIIVLVNVFFSRHHHRFDFTESKLHSLSDQSIKVAQALKTDISVKAFFREGNPGRGPDGGPAQDLRLPLAEDQIRVHRPGQEPRPGQALRGHPGRHDHLRVPATRTTASRPSTEEDVTNAIIKVTREKKKIVYFLEGHGEKSIGGHRGERHLLRQGRPGQDGLRGQEAADLALPAAFPADCALLVVPGPREGPRSGTSSRRSRTTSRAAAGSSSWSTPRPRPALVPYPGRVRRQARERHHRRPVSTG